MRPVLSIERPLVNQPQIGLMNQRCALQGMPRTFPLEMVPRDVAQFLVDERNQGLQRFFVARFPAYDQLANRVGMLLIHSQLRPQTQ